MAPVMCKSLQWGRDREVADSREARDVVRDVPMRFNGAATARSRIDLTVLAPWRISELASMGPRPRGRG